MSPGLIRLALCIVFSGFIHLVCLLAFFLIYLAKSVELKLTGPVYGQERVEYITCNPDHAYQHVFGLRRLDPIAFEMAKSLARHPVFDLEGTRFYVSCHPVVIQKEAVVTFGNGKVVNSVYLSPFILRDRHFKAIISHELAHIKSGHLEDSELNSYLADELAEKVVPWWTIEDWREEVGPPPPIVLLDNPE